MRGRETPLCPRGQRLSASQAGWASASWRAEPAAAPLGAHSRSAAEACSAAASCGPSPRAADVSSCLKLTRPVGKFYDSGFPGKPELFSAGRGMAGGVGRGPSARPHVPRRGNRHGHRVLCDVPPVSAPSDQGGGRALARACFRIVSGPMIWK